PGGGGGSGCTHRRGGGGSARLWIPEGLRLHSTGPPNVACCCGLATRSFRRPRVSARSLRSMTPSRPHTRGDRHMAQKKPTVYEFIPKLGQLRDDVLFGDVWEHPDLSKRDRSLITVAMLAA